MTVEKIGEEKAQEVRAQPTVYEVDLKKSVPLLKHGARLTRDEFERRYNAMPYLKKAELIEGVVYMPPPVQFDIHGQPHADIMGWLGVYRAATPGVWLADNATVRLEGDNEPQPDALLRIDTVLGGNSWISNEGYVEGSPELIVEIAGTSADYDLHEKLEVYCRNGVQEYLVWQTQDKRLDWFQLIESEYVPLTPDADGVIQSQVFPGLRLAVEALLEGELAFVLAELQKGLEMTEHSAFIERLSNKI